MSTSVQPPVGDSPRLPPVPSRRWWLTLLLAALVFASGLVVGGGMTLIAVRNRALEVLRHPAKAPAWIAARLRSKLGLSEQQTRQVEEIIRARQRALQAIRRKVEPQVVVELDRVETQIAAVLNPTQRAKWHAMFTQLRATWLPPPQE